MAEQVGTKTGQKTSAGKEVYKTPEGESVSEKSVTIKFGDNAYVNAPSIHNGKRYTEDEIKEMLLEGIIKPTSRHDTLEEAIKAAKTRSDNLLKDGGMAKRMARQMELFEPVERGFDEGGLMEEGGMVDEESGNEVPPGSLREEVRDDIPAQLSEGEFVFPADVVRYIGLENLMRMRQEAKQGLAQMEAMGQMGNGDEAVMPDDLPFDMYDLDVDDEEEYNSETRNYQVGGYVPPSVPQQPYNQPTQVDPRTGTYTLPGTGIAGYQVPSGTPTGYVPYGGATPYFQPVQFTGAQYQTALQTTNLPTFAETVGSKPGQYDELRTYVNDAGQTLQIPFKDGKPIYPIPEGYRPIGDQPKEEETTVMPTLGETQVRDDDFGGGDKDDIPSPTTTSTTLGKIGSSLFGPSSAYNKAVRSLSAFQTATLSPLAALGATTLGLAAPRTIARMGNLARNSAINNFGLSSLDDASVDQLDAIGYAMDAAMNLSVADTSIMQALQSKTGLKAGSPTQAATAKAAATISDSLIGAYKDGNLSLEDLKNISEVEIDTESGAWKDQKAVKDYVDAVLSQELKDIEQGLIGTSKESGLTDAERSARRSAEIRDEISRGTYGLDRGDPEDRGGSVDEAAGKAGTGAPGTGAPGTGGLGPGGGGGTVGQGGTVGSNDGGGFDGGANEGGPDNGGGGSSGGGGGTGGSGGSGCFAAGTKFFMQDGFLKSVEDIKVGDIMMDGGKVRLSIVGDGSNSDWYMYGATKVTGSHPVREQGVWKFIRDAENAIRTETENLLYTIVNANHRMVAEDKVVYSDYDMVDEDGIEEELLEMMNLQDVVEEAA